MTTRIDLLGIVQVTVPVADPARSATWYRELLGLDYIREFTRDGQVTGCALADWSARYVVALRRRSTIAGEPDLRGEHPISLEAADEAAAERPRARAAALGIPATGARTRTARGWSSSTRTGSRCAWCTRPPGHAASSASARTAATTRPGSPCPMWTRVPGSGGARRRRGRR